MKNVRVLILEDDIKTLSYILSVLTNLEREKNVCIAATILPDYVQVEEFINKNPQIEYDILLLDRDCYLGGSFHVVNLDNFDKDKVISISSVPEYNERVVKKGVKRVVLKNYERLEEFRVRLKEEISKFIE